MNAGLVLWNCRWGKLTWEPWSRKSEVNINCCIFKNKRETKTPNKQTPKWNTPQNPNKQTSKQKTQKPNEENHPEITKGFFCFTVIAAKPTATYCTWKYFGSIKHRDSWVCFSWGIQTSQLTPDGQGSLKQNYNQNDKILNWLWRRWVFLYLF